VSPPATPQTAAAIAARRARTAKMLDRVRSTVQRMRREKTPITYQAVARRAGVSRTFLYQNPDARALIAEAAARVTDQRLHDQAGQVDQQEASWRERALNAEDALKAAHAEIRSQRTRIGEFMGQVRDLEAEWTQEAIQRITTENTTLKQRVRQLTQDNRTLEERLQAARSNLRFQDRRLADLEAQLATQPPTFGGDGAASRIRH
jgi:chromosome segregation ATPase